MKKAKQISFGSATTLALVILFSSFSSYAQARQPFLTRHVREIITNGEALPVGRLPETQTLRFDIVMPLRDRAALQTYLQELYDPSSRSFHHFLTPQEVTARYGPSQQDWDALAAFAKASGFEVLGGTRDGRDLWLTGTVANIEKAFNVTMTVYQDPTEEGRTFFSPDREPTTSLPFPLWHVSGLNNDAKPHPLYVKKSEYAKAHDTDPDAISNATTGSGPDASFLGSDMRHAYYCNGSCGANALTGTGQNIALFEFAGTDLTDLSTYYNNVGQTEPYTPTLISTGGYGTSCVDSGGRSKACDDTEQTLDMTQSMGMAPGSTMLYMYVCGDVLADNEGNISDTACISAMVSTTDAPLSMQISCSWGWTPDDPSTLDPYFEQMASQGQNFFAASGDDSAWSSSNEAWPADDANIVSVGGTDLTTSAAAGPWESETAWADSGGGVSPDDIPIPSWQTPVDGCSGCSKTYRNGPDVSANANFSFYVCADQTTCTANEYGGTSFATPMWAGYLALANEQAASNNESIGYINPNIYPAAEGSSYGTYFHDITSGSCGTYSAATGYDLCTGWGSPNTSGLINLLAPTGSNASTTTAVSSNLNPSTYGQDVTFTATVTASGSPVTSGTVQFVVDGNDLGSPVAVNSQGEAQATDAALSVGTHSVAANYLGATGYSSSSGSLSQVVNQASQTITCSTKPPTSAAYGSSFTIACTASSGLAVSYSSSGSCSNSGAAYTMTSASGACAVDVNQAGNSDYSAAPQVAYSVGATKATTSINVTSVNPSSEVYGQDAAVTITAVASWTGSGSAPSGSIVIGGNGNGTYSATSCGAPSGDTITCTATYTPSTNDVVGSYTETATIAGDSNYSGSSSPQTNNFSITQAGSGTITVSCTPDPSTYGGSVTCTATIPGQYNEITHKGKVRSQVVTGTVEWSSNTGCGTTTVNSGDPGTATCTTTILPVGSDTVTANYSGDSNHSAGSGSTSQTVNQVTTTTAISSSLDPSGYGQAVSFMATVTGSSPTGTVQFNIDGSAFGSPVTLSSGTATSSSINTLAVGTHTVTAVYSGDTNNAGSTGTLSGGQIVQSATSTVTVSSNLNPSGYGQSVTFTATVTGENGAVRGRVTRNGVRSQDVTGTVTWSSNTGCAPSTVSGYPGVATCTTSSLPVGTDTITAMYSGDGNHSGSTGTLSGGQVVNESASSTSVVSSLDPSTYGQAVSFTATVTGSSPTGTVQFNIDGSAFGSPVTLSAGTATSGSINTLAVGTHTVTAVYSGDSNNGTSTGTVSGGQVVQSASAAVTVTSGLNPSTYGQSVTFTATINGEYGLIRGRVKSNTVTGTVTWSSNTGCGTTTVTSGNPGTATCTTSTLGGGNDTITATYSGDANHSGSTGSLTGGQTVNQASQTINCSGIPSSATYNTSFTASCSASSGLAVSYGSSGGCSNAGAMYTMTSGTTACTVIANQAGNGNYTAAPQFTQTVTAVKANPTVSFTGLPSTLPYSSTYMVTATTNASTSAVITDSTKTVCSLSGSSSPATVSILKDSGTCALTATWAADANYNAGSAIQSGTVTKGVVAVNWATPAPITYGTALSASQLDATANLPGTFTYSPAAGKIEDAGNVTLNVTFKPTNTDYATTTDTVTLQVLQLTTTTTITSQDQTVKLNSSGTADATVDVNVTSYKPTGTVTLTANTGEMCSGTVASSTGDAHCKLTFTTTGTRTITATYGGDNNHTGSNNSSQSPAITITVNPY